MFDPMVCVSCSTSISDRWLSPILTNKGRRERKKKFSLNVPLVASQCEPLPWGGRHPGTQL